MEISSKTTSGLSFCAAVTKALAVSHGPHQIKLGFEQFGKACCHKSVVIGKKYARAFAVVHNSASPGGSFGGSFVIKEHLYDSTFHTEYTDNIR